MLQNISKKTLILTSILVGAIVIISLSVYFILKKSKPRQTDIPVTEQTQDNGAAIATSSEAQATTSPTAKSGSLPKTTSSLTYTKAMELYGNGFRFQFSDCHGNPGQMSIRQGVKFMLDNRDNKAHTIVIKSQTFRIPAYGFAIATAKELGTYNITCDGGGAAELNVENK